MKKLIPHTFALALSAFSLNAFAAPATTTTAMPISASEKAKIEQVVHDYLIQKPEVLVQAMQVLQQRQMDEAQNTVKTTQKTAANYAKALFQQPSDPMVGNPKADIAIVEFYDYQCPHCLDMAPVIANILKDNANVRVVFKDFPIRGPLSDVAARASIAAHKQGKYYELNHALLTANKPLTEALIYQTAKEKGINVEQMKKDMNDKPVEKQLQDNMKLAQDLKLFGTPAFFVTKNDGTYSKIEYLPGQVNQKQLQDIINKMK